jgi:hypothetical protein
MEIHASVESGHDVTEKLKYELLVQPTGEKGKRSQGPPHDFGHKLVHAGW